MRLIDADALIENKFKNDISYNAFKNLVKRQPSVDVQPVRHGHWIETTEQSGWIEEECAECSECSNTFVLGEYTIDDIRELFKYCPNCGARMDGEQDG